MKKLMIAAAIVCAAVVSQAASFSWSQTAGKVYDGTNTKTLYSGTAWLIDGSKTSQQALLTAAMSGDFDIADYAIANSSSTISGGVVAGSSAFSYNVAESFQAYYAIVEDGKIFLSNDVASGWQQASEQAIDFTTSPAKSSNNLAISGGTYSTANSWYQTVPEPTSGLLLLIGMAGLALRRRRA